MPEVDIIVKAKDQASKTLGGVDKTLKGLSSTTGLFQMAGVAGFAAVGAGITKLAWDAMELEPTRITFENLAESIDTTSEALLAKLHPATMDMVSDADLMKAANKLMAMGLAETSDEAAKLSEMAVKLGTAMGKGPTQAMEEFALMLANQSIPRLDTFGISAGKVRTRINELMEADKSLTREQAFMNAVMEQGEISMGKVGDVSDTTAVKMARVRAVISDMKADIGEALIPILDTAAETFLNTKEAIADVINEKEEIIKATYEAVESEQEFIDAMYDTLPPLIKQEILLSETKKAVFDAAYAKEYERKKSEELIAILEPLTESYTDLEHEINKVYKVGDKLIRDIYKPMASSLKELYEAQTEVGRGMQALPSWIGWVADAEEHLALVTRYGTEQVVIRTQEVASAEIASYEQRLAAAQAFEAEQGAIWDGVKQRLDETKAGLHGVSGAYDELAITTEDAEPFKVAWEQAKENVGKIKEEWTALGSALEQNIVTAIVNTRDPGMAAWQGFLTDMQTAQSIADKARAETMLESWSTALPGLDEILADMVRKHEINLGEIPLEHRQAVADVLLEWAGVGPELEKEGSKWDTIVAEATGKMKKSFIDDTFDPAIDRVGDYTRHLRDLDGTDVHVHIYEHYHIVREEEMP